MYNKHTWCVIMAGGSGTRFWPVSTSDNPKQFQSFGAGNETLIQHTAARFRDIIPVERTLIVTSAGYLPLVKSNLPEIPEENILLEPYNRDTAPCIALAMYTILKRDPDGIMVVTPSDHLIFEKDKFSSLISKVTDEIQDDSLLTIGIKPTRPDINYGYIQVDGEIENGKWVKVKTFTEKPDAELARVFLQSGDFLWNSGIFIWKADTIRREMEKYLPQVKELFRGWEGALDSPASSDFLEKVYSDMQKISIDYAIMERTDKAWTCPSDIGWYDIGTWESFYNFVPDKDAAGNAGNTPRLSFDGGGNLLISSDSEKLIAVCGLENYVVADTGKVIFVCPRDDRKLREFVSNLALGGFDKYR